MDIKDIRKRFIKEYGDCPLISITHRRDGKFIEIHTAGWQPRAISLGLQFIRDDSFSKLYKLGTLS